MFGVYGNRSSMRMRAWGSAMAIAALALAPSPALASSASPTPTPDSGGLVVVGTETVSSAPDPDGSSTSPSQEAPKETSAPQAETSASASPSPRPAHSRKSEPRLLFRGSGPKRVRPVRELPAVADPAPIVVEQQQPRRTSVDEARTEPRHASKPQDESVSKPKPQRSKSGVGLVAAEGPAVSLPVAQSSSGVSWTGALIGLALLMTSLLVLAGGRQQRRH